METDAFPLETVRNSVSLSLKGLLFPEDAALDGAMPE